MAPRPFQSCLVECHPSRSRLRKPTVTAMGRTDCRDRRRLQCFPTALSGLKAGAWGKMLHHGSFLRVRSVRLTQLTGVVFGSSSLSQPLGLMHLPCPWEPGPGISLLSWSLWCRGQGTVRQNQSDGIGVPLGPLSPSWGVPQPNSSTVLLQLA